MRYKKEIFILTLVLVFVFSLGVSAGPQDKIEDMNFRNAEVVDVLRAIAEIADVNLITDSEVAGNTTVHLKDISFAKALDLITQTKGLAYKWDENTVVVASPERLDTIYDDIVTEYVEVDSSDFDNIGTIVKEIFPETQITVDAARRQFIIKGEKSKAVEIIEMINRLDTAQRNEEQKQIKAYQENDIKVTSESYNVVNADIEDFQDKLRTINPNITIKINPLTNVMTLTGPESEVQEALSMAETYDQSLEPETRNIRVDYVDAEEIDQLISKFYPDINYHVNQKRKEVIINGSKNKLENVAKLLRQINIPKQQVIIEARVEEISKSKSQELGINPDEFTRIKFIKESDIDTADIHEVKLTWPDYLDALQTDGLTETLANPRLMTLNGETAEMLIGEEVPIPQGRDENNNIEYEYEPAGVSLTFTPWITENNEIEIEIIPEVSSFGETVVGGLFPIKRTRRVSTKLRLEDGETIAIGGLIQQEDIKNVNKVPLLGDIPILGELFKYRDNDDSKTELIVFVTPRIINDNSSLKDDHLITTNVDNNKEKNNTAITESEKSKEEIINEYLEESSKERKELLNSIRKDKKEKEFEDLSPAELEAILAN